MKKLSWSLVLVAIVTFSSCELKEELEKTASALEAAEALQEYTVVNKQFQDASNASDDGVINAEDVIAGTYALKAGQEGPSITVEPMDNTWPKTITLDFGDGITGKDGIVRSGKIKTVSTAWYRESGSVHTTTYENFYQNDHKVEGTNVATNMGMVEGLGLKYNVEIKDGKITTPPGGVISYTQNSSRTWIAGDDTPINIWDDEYKLDGTQNGVSSKGIVYSLTITEPLHFVMYPRDILAGKITFAIDGLSDIELDYETSKGKIGDYEFTFNK